MFAAAFYAYIKVAKNVITSGENLISMNSTWFEIAVCTDLHRLFASIAMQSV